jgi:hypothetical protein
MSDSELGSGRHTQAGSQHRRLWSFAASGPGIRVIELHILGMQIQLLSINMGRRWSLLRRSPANVTHSRVDRTITVEPRHGVANRCGRGDLIKRRQPVLLLSEVLECLRTMWR